MNHLQCARLKRSSRKPELHNYEPTWYLPSFVRGSIGTGWSGEQALVLSAGGRLAQHGENSLDPVRPTSRRDRGSTFAGMVVERVAVHDDLNEPGVIQMAPIYSGHTSWEGMNDTSSLDNIMAVVTATSC